MRHDFPIFINSCDRRPKSGSANIHSLDVYQLNLMICKKTDENGWMTTMVSTIYQHINHKEL